MKINRNIVVIIQLFLGIVGLILALPLGALFDKAAVSFEYASPLALDKWDKIGRLKLTEEEIAELPNIVQLFYFENLSSSKNIEGLRYKFILQGIISKVQLREGVELITNPEWDTTNASGKATLMIERLPPKVKVTGAILFRVKDPKKIPALEKPEASAFNISPEDLVLPRSAVLASTLRWLITVAIWLIAASVLIVYPF